MSERPRPEVLDLEGAYNFREVGGYPTAGGRLRRRLIWRSSALGGLTNSDCVKVRGSGARLIADLRTRAERETAPPSANLAAALEHLTWALEAGQGATWSPDSGAITASSSVDDVRAHMGRVFYELLGAMGEPITELVTRLAAGQGPVIVHCTHGKDRTGIVVGMLLELAGVEREWTLRDFEDTNRHVAARRPMIEEALAKTPWGGWLASLDPAVRDLILGVDRSYLQAAFATAEARHGSLETYAIDALGLSQDNLVSFRAQVVDPLPLL